MWMSGPGLGIDHGRNWGRTKATGPGLLIRFITMADITHAFHSITACKTIKHMNILILVQLFAVSWSYSSSLFCRLCSSNNPRIVAQSLYKVFATANQDGKIPMVSSAWQLPGIKSNSKEKIASFPSQACPPRHPCALTKNMGTREQTRNAIMNKPSLATQWFERSKKKW